MLISYFSSHAVVNPFGKDWFEPMILWIVIVMPTGAGKSTLFKFLRGILDTVRKRVIASGKDTSNNDALPDWAVEEASLEKNGGYDGSKWQQINWTLWRDHAFSHTNKRLQKSRPLGHTRPGYVSSTVQWITLVTENRLDLHNINFLRSPPSFGVSVQ